MRSRVFRPHAMALAATLGLAALSAHANLAANGGFETGDFSGWDVATAPADINFVAVDSQTPYEGTYAAYFGTVATSTLSQTIATVNGLTYGVSFALQSANFDLAEPVNMFGFRWNGSSVLGLADQAFGDYVVYHFQLQASSDASTLSFAFNNPTSFWNLDAVDVEATTLTAPVPEPSTFCLAGIGMAALWLRTRKTRPSATAGVTSPDAAA